GISASFAIHRRPSRQSNFLEGAVPLVMEQKFDHGVVGDEDVRVAVPVEIGDGNPERLGRFVEAQFMRLFGEGSVAIVVIDQHRDGWKDIGMTVATVALAMFAAPSVGPIRGDTTNNHESQNQATVGTNSAT